MMIPGTQKPVIHIDKTREPTRSSLFLAGVEPTQEFYKSFVGDRNSGDVLTTDA